MTTATTTAPHRKNQFDAEVLERQLAERDAQVPPSDPVPAEPATDPVLAEKDKAIAELTEKLDKLNARDAEIRRAEQSVTEQQLVITSLKDEIKSAKEEEEKRVAYLQGLIRSRDNGQMMLPFGAADDTPPAPPADKWLASHISCLGAKLIKNLDPDEFAAARDRDEPIGLTDKLLEKLESQDVGNIGALEEKMKTAFHWQDDVGVTEKQGARIADTLRVWRKHHPHVEIDVGQATAVLQNPIDNVADWTPDDAAAALNDLVQRCDTVLEDSSKEAGHDFCRSVRMDAESMRDEIATYGRVTSAQQEAVQNWTSGVGKWMPF